MNTKIYANALLSQNACNLSGILKSLARDIDDIWQEARDLGQGTDYVNQHPVIRLYLEQLVHLNKANMDSFDQYHKASEVCRKRSEGFDCLWIENPQEYFWCVTHHTLDIRETQPELCSTRYRQFHGEGEMRETPSGWEFANA
jgi:hypothetical protein